MHAVVSSLIGYTHTHTHTHTCKHTQGMIASCELLLYSAVGVFYRFFFPDAAWASVRLCVYGGEVRGGVTGLGGAAG